MKFFFFDGRGGGRDFSRLEHSGGIRPLPHVPMLPLLVCRQSHKLPVRSIILFIHLFLFIWYTCELFHWPFYFKNEIRMEEILQNCNCNFDMYPCVTQLQFIVKRKIKRLRWSRGSVLAFGTQVCGFTPGRSLRIFRAKKSSAHLPSEGK
jgi:hypothetical protein